MSERLRGVEVFVAVVDTGSFAAAAQRLEVTRSAVAKTIAKVEQRLMVRLFDRTTRRQRLTSEGHAYYERCVRALAELEAAEESLENGRKEPSGRLRMTAPVLFGRHCVAPIARSLSERYRELDIELSFSDRVVDLMEEGFDLAVRIGALPDSSQLVSRRLGLQRMGICASPEYLRRHGRPHEPHEFDGHVGIAYASGGRFVPWRIYGKDRHVIEPRINSRLAFDDLQAIADAAIAGAGLAWLPCWLMTPEISAGRLELLMNAEQVLATDIHAVWPRRTHMPLKVRVAIDALVEGIATLFGISTPVERVAANDPSPSPLADLRVDAR